MISRPNLFRTVPTTAMINGVEVYYDGCAETARGLDAAKRFYKGWKYLGRGFIYRVDGKIQNIETTYYFFRK